jgi:hypothetical protein
MKLASILDTEKEGYLENIFLNGKLIACIYSCHDAKKSWQQPQYKFSSKYNITPSDTYTSVSAAKHDLFLLLKHNGCDTRLTVSK